MRRIIAGLISLAVLFACIGTFTSCSTQGGTLTIGTTAQITGDFEPWWTDCMGDREVVSLIEGYSTVATDKDGKLIVNPQIVTDLRETENTDGSRTYTLTFAEDLRFSDGTPINAAHYAAWVLLFSSPVIRASGGNGSAGVHFVGWSEYFNGELDAFLGVRLLGPYQLSLTVSSADAVNYFGLYNIRIEPLALHVWLPADISVTETANGAKLTGNFTVESCLDFINAARFDHTDRVTTGAFRLASYDPEKSEAILMKNEYYKGSYDGTKPKLDQIVYKEVPASSMFAQLKDGTIDVLHGLTGASMINDALQLEESGNYKTIRYDSDGCDSLLFRCDYGPTQYEDVRRGIAYLLDRETLTETFLDDYGVQVRAPYGPVLELYDGIEDYAETHLGEYDYSPETAEGCFVRAGFILGENGEPYESGIRYKEVTPEEAATFARCVYLNGRYLMPLIIDWCTYQGSTVGSYLRFLMTDSTEAKDTGISFSRTELPYEEYLAVLYRDDSREEKYGAQPYGMFDIFYSFGTVYDVSGLYTADAARRYSGENLAGLYDPSFSDASKLASGVAAGDDAAFLAKFNNFASMHNRLLPELPLYSAVTVDVFSTKVNGYDAGAMKSIAQSVLKCSIGK
ncbi:MAG: ABC transporter substrate-binding protein [Clostridia bacterium]|nr:ABC transporter substrate-binding protein [Clostridia bacterium]